jgi:hypothetical protein
MILLQTYDKSWPIRFQDYVPHFAARGTHRGYGLRVRPSRSNKAMSRRPNANRKGDFLHTYDKRALSGSVLSSREQWAVGPLCTAHGSQSSPRTGWRLHQALEFPVGSGGINATLRSATR